MDKHPLSNPPQSAFGRILQLSPIFAESFRFFLPAIHPLPSSIFLCFHLRDTDWERICPLQLRGHCNKKYYFEQDSERRHKIAEIAAKTAEKGMCRSGLLRLARKSSTGTVGVGLHRQSALQVGSRVRPTFLIFGFGTPQFFMPRNHPERLRLRTRWGQP